MCLSVSLADTLTTTFVFDAMRGNPGFGACYMTGATNPFNTRAATDAQNYKLKLKNKSPIPHPPPLSCISSSASTQFPPVSGCFTPRPPPFLLFSLNLASTQTFVPSDALSRSPLVSMPAPRETTCNTIQRESGIRQARLHTCIKATLMWVRPCTFGRSRL